MYLFEIHVVWASSAQDRKPMTVEMTACQSIFPFLLTIEALEAFTRPSKLKRPTKQLPPWLMMKKSLPLSSTTVSLSSVVLGAWRSSDRGPMRRREPAVTVTRFAFGLFQPSVTLLHWVIHTTCVWYDTSMGMVLEVCRHLCLPLRPRPSELVPTSSSEHLSRRQMTLVVHIYAAEPLVSHGLSLAHDRFWYVQGRFCRR